MAPSLFRSLPIASVTKRPSSKLMASEAARLNRSHAMFGENIRNPSCGSEAIEVNHRKGVG